jgi:hypothetical protein
VSKRVKPRFASGGRSAIEQRLSGSDTARLDYERAAARRLCPACTSAGSCAFSSADAIGFTVSVAAAGLSSCWRCGVHRRRIRIAAAGSVSLSRINCRLGQ